MGPSGRGGLGKKTTMKLQRPQPCLFSIVVRCFLPKGSCSLCQGRGMHQPLPQPICTPSPAALTVGQLSPLAPWPAPPSLLALATSTAWKTT